jgi:hypothetical protein
MKITVVLGIIAKVAAVGAVDLVTTLVLSGQAFANGAPMHVHILYKHLVIRMCHSKSMRHPLTRFKDFHI